MFFCRKAKPVLLKQPLKKMDLLLLWGKLYKNKWLILFIAVFSAATAFWFAEQQPLSYKSAAIISTGVINNPNEVSSSAAYIQPYRVDNTLSAIIEMMKSRVSLSMLSKELYLHDFEQNQNSFRILPVESGKYTENERRQIADWIRSNENHNQIDLPGRMGEIYNELLKALGYDQSSILKHLKIERVGSTDYIRVEFTSNHPALSAFTVNSLSERFTENYNASTNAQTKNSLQYYTQLAEDKKRQLTGKVESLRQYKLNNNVVDYTVQAKTTIEQIRDLELQREEISQKIPSYEQAIRNYNRYLNQNDHTLGQLREYNREVAKTKEKINTLTQQYVNGGSKDKELKNQIDALNIQLEVHIKNSALGQQSIQNSTSKKEIEAQKIEAETELEIAKASLVSVNQEIQRLKSSTTGLVSGEAAISNLEQDINSYSTEYLEILNRLNSTEFAVQSLTNPLNIIEKGILPEKAEASKTAMITALAGVSGFMLATAFIFFLAFIDNSYTTPNRFTQFTGLPVLETVNYVNGSMLPGLSSWFNKKNKEFFSEAIRKLRFSVEESGAKRILFTSLYPKEGKTYLAIALAHALMRNSKQVLLIDTNFKNNTISKILNKNSQSDIAKGFPLALEMSELKKLVDLYRLNKSFSTPGAMFSQETGDKGGVVVMASYPQNNSPSEVFSQTDFNAFLDKASLLFDFIIMEGAAINKFADTKEMVRYTDKMIAVFSASSSYKPNDANALNYFKNLSTNEGGNKFLGAVLNKVKLSNLN